MRASLPHPISRRRREHRFRGGHRSSPAHEPYVGEQRADVAAQRTEVAAQAIDVAAQRTEVAAQAIDVAAQPTGVASRATAIAAPEIDVATRRVRAAGGPTDLASYACQCGYLFTAAVTTSVGCPHCGTLQAW